MGSGRKLKIGGNVSAKDSEEGRVVYAVDVDNLFLVVNVKRGFRKQIISPNTHSLAKSQHNPSYFPTIRFYSVLFFCFTRLVEMGFLDGAPPISGGVGGDWARQAKHG